MNIGQVLISTSRHIYLFDNIHEIVCIDYCSIKSAFINYDFLFAMLKAGVIKVFSVLFFIDQN